MLKERGGWGVAVRVISSPQRWHWIWCFPFYLIVVKISRALGSLIATGTSIGGCVFVIFEPKTGNGVAEKLYFSLIIRVFNIKNFLELQSLQGKTQHTSSGCGMRAKDKDKADLINHWQDQSSIRGTVWQPFWGDMWLFSWGSWVWLISPDARLPAPCSFLMNLLPPPHYCTQLQGDSRPRFVSVYFFYWFLLFFIVLFALYLSLSQTTQLRIDSNELIPLSRMRTMTMNSHISSVR